MSKKKIDEGVPITWVDELKNKSSDELIHMIISQHVQILNLEHQVQHLQTQTRANSVDEYRDDFIKVSLANGDDDELIAKNSGTTVRVVREIRNQLGNKKPRGRPKKVS
jgi:hypothetical protein